MWPQEEGQGHYVLTKPPPSSFESLAYFCFHYFSFYVLPGFGDAHSHRVPALSGHASPSPSLNRCARGLGLGRCLGCGGGELMSLRVERRRAEYQGVRLGRDKEDLGKDKRFMKEQRVELDQDEMSREARRKD